jgi:hypothetical protein
MPRRITRLSISEISSVDRGAAGDRQGRGKASVLLLKNERTNPMDTAAIQNALGTVHLAKRATEAIESGDWTTEQGNEFLKKRAAKEFPNEANNWIALNKALSTDWGRELNNALVRAELMKRVHKDSVPHIEHASNTAPDGDDDSPSGDADFGQRVEAAMKEKGMTRLQAIDYCGTEDQRKEKVAKNQVW